MTASGWHDAWVGVGGNLHEPRTTVLQALDALAGLRSTRLVARSSLWRTAPVDADGPDYVNAVVHLQTGLSPDDLLAELQALEQRFHRERPYRNAPRTLDLDVLLYDALAIDSPTLTLPHPRMHERAFVLAPLAELAPTLELPGRGDVRALLARCADQRIERIE